jgi:high-affinity Fe2+/Pb2+ permease
MPKKESAKPVVSTAQLILKACLIVSVAVGCLIIVLAGVGDRGLVQVSAGVISVVAIQWFFYLVVSAKHRAQPGAS